jgi:ABC-type dipeptide/oligopeptide/nickel transport system permease component
VAFYFAVVVVIANLLVDVSYRLLSPRMRET